MGLLSAICDVSEVEPPIFRTGVERVGDAVVRAAVLEAAESVEHLGRVVESAVDAGGASR